MANQALVDRKLLFPNHLLQRILVVGKDALSVQMQNFISKGFVTYDDLKNVIKVYPQLSDTEIHSYGGEVFFKWCRGMLTRLRDRVKQSKENKSNLGKPNAFIKSHDKSAFGRAHSKKGLYENVKTIFISKENLNILKNGRHLF